MSRIRLKWLFCIAASLLILAAGGFVVVGLNQAGSESELWAKYYGATPIALPTVLVGFPDIEHIPVYPDATVTLTKTESTKLNHISYQVTGWGYKVGVAEFYREMLPKKGWHLINGRGGRNLYNWTDPEGKLLWNLYIDVYCELTLDNTTTAVYLDYGRYPNTAEGLPLYLDAQQVSITHSIVEKSFPSGKTPVHVTDISYLSSASPQKIAAFYTNSMQEYGWYNREPGWSTQEHGWNLFDNPGSWEGNSAHEGLYFVASRPTWGEKSGVHSYQLLATATLKEDGRAIIKLHVEDFESSLGNF